MDFSNKDVKLEKKVNRPHDKAFKRFFSNRNVALDFLKKSINQEILDYVDLDLLEPTNVSFIDDSLKEKFSDVAYKTKIAGKEGYVCFLWEHKSYIDNNAVFQILRYIVEIWSKCYSDDPNSELPIIIPILVYAGKEKKWSALTDLSKMISGYNELPEKIKELMPTYRYELVNLVSKKERDLGAYAPLTRLIVKVMVGVFQQSKDEFAKVIITTVSEAFESVEESEVMRTISVIFTYLAETRKDISSEVLIEKAKELGSMGERVLSVLDEVERKGIEKGIEKGKLETAREALVNGVEIRLVERITGISLSKLQEMKKELEIK